MTTKQTWEERFEEELREQFEEVFGVAIRQEIAGNFTDDLFNFICSIRTQSYKQGKEDKRAEIEKKIVGSLPFIMNEKTKKVVFEYLEIIKPWLEKDAK